MDGFKNSAVDDVIDYHKLTKHDVLRMQFDKVEDAEDFYKNYSLAIGFSIRKDAQGFSKERMTRRQWVCSKEGVRASGWNKRKDRAYGPKMETRESCKSRFRINYAECVGAYVVREFIDEHNHVLAKLREVQFLRSHRVISEANLAIANTMREASIRTCNVMEYMVNQAGGYTEVGFMEQDLYNKLNSRRRAASLDGDSQSALSYMEGRAATDPHFYCRITVDKLDRLENVFWRDSHSLVEYSSFGDVLIFDSTYKTNSYMKPLVLFVGTNNHRGTIVFGAALLVNETEESYIWALKVFLHSMMDKKPISVVTDGDESMRKAIDTVLPEARHRLCLWHIARNAPSYLHDAALKKAFNKCMRKYQSIEQFETMWEQMIDDFKLENHEWIRTMYQKRHRWAQAYLGDHFFAGIRSTQRCESMNNFIKGYVGQHLKLYEFVLAIHRALLKMRNNEAEADFFSKIYKPVPQTHLSDLEEEAAKYYTHGTFSWIKKECLKDADYFVLDSPVDECNCLVFTISKYKMKEMRWEVIYYHLSDESGCDEKGDERGCGVDDTEDPIMECSCRMFEYKGISCRHMMCVMKHLHMTTIPKSLMKKRWLKSARSGCTIEMPENDIQLESLQATRFGALSIECNRLCFHGSRTADGYIFLKNEIERLTYIVEDYKKKAEDAEVKNNAATGVKGRVIKDPSVVKTKGRVKGISKSTNRRRLYHCRACGGAGHNKSTCPRKKNSKLNNDE